MVKKSLFFLILFLLPFEIYAQGEKPAQLRIFEEPKSKEWWFRTEFLAAGSSIREIPAHEIDPTWHYASELTKDAIPKKLLLRDGADLMNETEITFSRSGDFNNDGIDDLALVGVYEDCNLQTGRFFLILTKNKLNKWEVSFLRLLGEPKFLAISASGPLKISFCMECEETFHLLWSSEKNEYTLKP